MDKSHSNSQQSNFFIISSQSSRSAHHKGKKEKYVKFARKVQELLDVQGTDLDELYRKLEIIVSKYFNQHKIVQFAQMYEYLVALKDNSKKMNEIVGILETRLSNKEGGKGEQMKNGKKFLKSQQFETTSTTQKQTKNSIYHSSHKQSQIENHNSFDDHDAVNTSIKYNHVFKPSINTKGQERNTQQRQVTKNQIIKNNQLSPVKSTTSKRSFGEQYKNRNKQYQLKVKKMMEELQQIKQKIVNSNNIQSNNLRIDLKPNQQKQKQPQQPIRQIQLEHQTSQQILSKNNQSQNSSILHQQQIVRQSMPIHTIISNTSNITRQIQELKQAALRLQKYSSFSNISDKQKTQSINPPKKLAEDDKNKQQKTPILQKIQNTTSQIQISENNIPSFKYITNNFKKQRIQQTKIEEKRLALDLDNLSSSNILASYPSNHQNKYNISTVKYIYNPSQPLNHNRSIIPHPQPFHSIVQPQTIPVQKNIIYFHNVDPRIQGQQVVNQRNSMYYNSPMNSSKSSTSILHPHLFNRQASVQRNQQYLVNSIGAVGNSSIMSSKSNRNSSSSSLHRKGLNLTSTTKL